MSFVEVHNRLLSSNCSLSYLKTSILLAHQARIKYTFGKQAQLLVVKLKQAEILTATPGRLQNLEFR